MSLTSHLSDHKSPITVYLSHRYPYTDETMRRLRVCMSNVIQPPPQRDTYPFGLIGRAIDYRIRFAFEVPKLRDLWAGKGISHYVRRFFDDYTSEYEDEYARTLIRFFTLDTTTPEPLRHLLAPTDERALARFCLILGHFEGYARSGELKIRPRDTLEKTLAIPLSDEVEDLYHLTELFYNSCQHWFSLPVICNPVFPQGDLIGGSDGDIIVNGCLFDFKCSKRTRPDETWIYQMVGYILLDSDQAFTSCGYYFPRHSSLTQWKTLPWLQHLARDHDLSIESEQERFMACIHEARQQAYRAN